MEFKIKDKVSGFSGFFKLNTYTMQIQKYDGTWSGEFKRELFERGHAAAILPYDPILDKVVLIEQFRPGAVFDCDNPWLIEIVAGMIDGDDNSKDTVIREMVEESGVECTDTQYVNSFFTSPGGTTEKIDLYIGKVDSTKATGVHGLATENEDIKVFSVPFSEAYEMVMNGTIKNAISIIAIQHLMLNKDKIIASWSK